ncbi:Flp family type IVb pilin [Pseudomonas nicosulfuronedens]|uniref:Flp family type IVb pilin n=1 Tax=Pseudomonas nicosulfuronedens TaxID=2571105 RepID=A0A5R9RQK6_9PSED|nr:Flp family type IVb pilin [Pseudomonas nicosulfuronedens]MDH1007637.1 Flp family type IVb pilin [Pseudomonas nicosulfuronedens]MDH1977682.1 Flp family type IVb pilin [Pseudomonas nicosulfuronedens]MDH2025718.1 Flp family type IVb pilin [Pseudomonas nicosulfuronedens]TLX79268.1 Flp family type IVb pilin [Pseudomonas nicosulfuronedens]
MKNLSLKLICIAKAFAADKEGATAIEYAVIAGLISVVVIAGASIIGGDLGTIMTSIQDEVAKAVK